MSGSIILMSFKKSLLENVDLVRFWGLEKAYLKDFIICNGFLVVITRLNVFEEAQFLKN